MYNLGKRLFHSLTAKVYCSRPPASSDDAINISNSISTRSNSAGSEENIANAQVTPAVGRKRARSGDATPTLFFSPNAFASKVNYASTVSPQGVSEKPLKRVKWNEHNKDDIDDDDDVHVKQSHVKELDEEQVATSPCSRHDSNSSLFLEIVPQDVLQANIFSYLTEARDHYALQLTCKKFHEVSNKTDMLSKVNLTGNAKTGKGGILFGVDDPGIAIEKLYKFAAVGNQQAMYM
jgi:hypothetical protein